MHLPEHPKGSTTHTDQQGSFVAYHKVCKKCQIELTSRNRQSGGALKCKECARVIAKDLRQEIGGEPRPRGRPRKTASGTEVHHGINPERQEVHSLLTQFLTYPLIETMKDDLLAGLVTFEIRALCRSLRL
jgi:hypothetical protein